MEKKAISFTTDQISLAMKAIPMALTAVGITGMGLKSVINKINNDAQRKRMLEDIALNDPMLKSVDKSTLLSWYASMYQVAPTLTKDRNTVIETLRTFKQFGKIDIHTIKLLADTEKTVSGNKDNGFGPALSHKFL